jgi:hypothetical protein
VRAGLQDTDGKDTGVSGILILRTNHAKSPFPGSERGFFV